MRKNLLLLFIPFLLFSCASLPEGEETSGGASSAQESETLLSRQVVAAQEQSAKLEVRLAEFEKKVTVLGKIVRRLTQRQSEAEGRIDRLARGGVSRSYSPPPAPRKKKTKKTARSVRRPAPRAPAPKAPAKARPAAASKAPAGSGPVSMQEAYNLAYRAIRQRKSEEAILLFRNFLRRFPKSRLAANAQYWLGESYYDLKEYPASLEEFQKVLLRYPRSRKVPDALFKRALTYNRMKNPRSAALEFEKLIEKYPRHPLSQKAGGRLRGMRK